MTPHPRPSTTSTLWYYGKSTKWEGASRFAIYFALVAALLTIAQFASGIYVGQHLLRMSTHVHCRESDVNHSSTQKARPVTFQVGWYDPHSRQESRKLFSLGAKGEKLPTAFIAFVNPFLLVIPSLTLTLCHFRKEGVSNRQGIVYSFFLILFLLLTMTTNAYLRVDSFRVVDQWHICSLLPEDVAPLLSERAKRLRCMLVREWLTFSVTFCWAFYLPLAALAAHLSFKRSQSDTRRVDIQLGPMHPTNHPSSAQGHSRTPNDNEPSSNPPPYTSASASTATHTGAMPSTPTATHTSHRSSTDDEYNITMERRSEEVARREQRYAGNEEVAQNSFADHGDPLRNSGSGVRRPEAAAGKCIGFGAWR